MNEEERTLALLMDGRMVWLEETPEFHGARKSLKDMHDAGQYDEGFIRNVERHIVLIDRHLETITVNGEEREVWFMTRVHND
jgi:hypothetical protein